MPPEPPAPTPSATTDPTPRAECASEVWVCTSGTEYESSGVDAVYADVHGARSWLSKERNRVIREWRKREREFAEIEERKPDYSSAPNCPLWTDGDDNRTEGFYYSDQWWRITPWRVRP